jgi:hypothetical protein
MPLSVIRERAEGFRSDTKLMAQFSTELYDFSSTGEKVEEDSSCGSSCYS